MDGARGGADAVGTAQGADVADGVPADGDWLSEEEAEELRLAFAREIERPTLAA